MAWTDRLERLRGLRDHLPWRRDRGSQVHIDHSHQAVGPPRGQPALSPRVSIYENDSEILVCADLPGVIADTCEVHVDDDILEISARSGDLPTGKRTLLTELPSGSWYRRFRLPDSLAGTEATASLSSGVLTVHIPRRQRGADRHIPIRSGG